MLPYFQQPVLALGRWHITAFAVCAVAALIIARWIILRRARRFNIGYQEIAPLYLSVIVAALAGAVAEPLFTARGGLASHGAILGGLAGGMACCWVQRIPWPRAVMMLDIAAFAAPFAGAIGRLGCALAHDHRGLPAEGWFAVHFPEGGRYDLGFIDLLFLSALCVVFVAVDRKPRPSLFFMGLAAVAYGAFRLWRERLDVTSDYLAWTVVLAIGVAALWLGRVGWRSTEQRFETHPRSPAKLAGFRS